MLFFPYEIYRYLKKKLHAIIKYKMEFNRIMRCQKAKLKTKLVEVSGVTLSSLKKSWEVEYSSTIITCIEGIGFSYFQIISFIKEMTSSTVKDFRKTIITLSFRW